MKHGGEIVPGARMITCCKPTSLSPKFAIKPEGANWPVLGTPHHSFGLRSPENGPQLHPRTKFTFPETCFPATGVVHAAAD
eukprot:1146664-Pelagomonas_calceolata.AAC.3